MTVVVERTRAFRERLVGWCQ